MHCRRMHWIMNPNVKTEPVSEGYTEINAWPVPQASSFNSRPAASRVDSGPVGLPCPLDQTASENLKIEENE